MSHRDDDVRARPAPDWSSPAGAGRTLVAAAVRLDRAVGRRLGRASVVVVVVVAVLALASEPILDVVARTAAGDARGQLQPLPQTSIVYAGNGTALGVFEAQHRRNVAIGRVPDHVVALVLAAEDRRFAEHRGYDLVGMARAALTNARAGEVEQGGSTITQQLAKLNFTDRDRSLDRKVEELLYAVRLEDQLSKDELLQRYLNQVYLGNGAHGITAAADEYFGRAPQDLTVAQAALLAGMIQAPAELDPRDAPEAARQRRDAVLARAADEGMITRASARQARAEPLGVAPDAPRPRTGPVLDAVRAEARTIGALGPTPAARLRRLETAGLRIETTIDPGLQAHATATIASTFPEAEGATGAAASLDPATGAIRALASERSGPGGFDLARQGRRQPGSAFKPLTAVAALEARLDPDQRLVGDGPIVLRHGGPRPWVVDNHGGADVGRVDLGEALRRSVNTAFAQLGVAVGADALADLAARVGIDVEAALGGPAQRGPSIALGGLAHGVSPLELARAYTAFANDGVVAEPHLIERIVAPDGDVVYERAPQAVQAVAPDIAAQVRAMLEDALAEGTGRAARIDGVDAFGKTGTSQDGADAWFVGSTTTLTTAVWVGHPDARVAMPDATGGSLAAPIWRTITAAAAAANPPGSWPAPPALTRQWGLELPDARGT